MVALRSLAVPAFSGPFWLSAAFAALAPTSVGYQDLAALLARQPGVAERWRDHMIASPFGTIHAATFSFARPLGTAMSEPIEAQTVNFDPRAVDVKVWSGRGAAIDRPALQVEYPTVNRQLKGDRMPLPQSSPAAAAPATLPPLQPIEAPSALPVQAPPPPHAPIFGPRPKNAEQVSPAMPDTPVDAFGWVPPAASGSGNDDSTGSIAPVSAVPNAADETEDEFAAADKPPEISTTGEISLPEAPSSPFASMSFVEEGPAQRRSQIYFGSGMMGSPEGLERWAPGAEPVPASPAADPDIKLSALEGQSDAGPGGETIADRNNLSRAMSPAGRLGLAGKPLAKAEKCLADAVYFEARGEPLRGQMAVAQVVINRVFSGAYPNDVCGVVYQNANRRLACQFTFACEGKDLSKIDEADMWEQAKRIAKDMLDGKIWLTEVGHATHYHAYWVHPSWVHEMKRMYQLGVHTFYRPRAWMDGSAEAPAWTLPPAFNPDGSPAQPAEAGKDPAGAKGPEAAVRSPQAAVQSEQAPGKNAPTAKL